MFGRVIFKYTGLNLDGGFSFTKILLEKLSSVFFSMLLTSGSYICTYTHILIFLVILLPIKKVSFTSAGQFVELFVYCRYDTLVFENIFSNNYLVFLLLCDKNNMPSSFSLLLLLVLLCISKSLRYIFSFIWHLRFPDWLRYATVLGYTCCILDFLLSFYSFFKLKSFIHLEFIFDVVGKSPTFFSSRWKASCMCTLC